MSEPKYRALRFVHPAFDAGPAGLQVSLNGRIATVEEDAAVRQSILLLIATRPGERVMLPGYGCDLQQLLFWPNDDTTAGLAMHYVNKAVTQWEPRVEILRVDAERNSSDPARLDLVLHYRLKTSGDVQHLQYALSLNGERG